MQIEIKINGLDKLVAKLKDFPVALKRAIRNATDTTATAVKNIAVKEAERTFNVAKARLTKTSKGSPTIYVKRTTQTEQHATVTFKGGAGAKAGDRPGLQHYATNKPPRKRTKGWKPSYRTRRAGMSEVVERGFYGEGKLKGQGIFERQVGSKKIVRRTGPGIKQIVERREVMSVVKREGEEVFKAKVVEAVGKQLKKLKGK